MLEKKNKKKKERKKEYIFAKINSISMRVYIYIYIFSIGSKKRYLPTDVFEPMVLLYKGKEAEEAAKSGKGFL